ncbi:MAG: DUF5714 domain-containing protein [Nitrospirota bacterium]
MSGKQKTEHCAVCGGPLEYLTTAKEVRCDFCRRSYAAHAACPQGHVLCDSCHGKEARSVIEDLALTSTSQDPGEIAEQMMAHPLLPMLSCDHAFIAAGALMAAIRNSPYGKVSDEDIREAFMRTAQQAHGGYCGLTGVCGIVPAVGAVFSIFLGARCGTDREQKIVMEAVTQVSRAVTDLTGPSCCKAYVRAAVPVAAGIFAEKFGIALPIKNSSPSCGHALKHPHGCREERCPYYRKPSRDVFAERTFMPGTTACVT